MSRSTRKSRQAGADRRRRATDRNARRPIALEGQRLDEPRAEIDMGLAPPTPGQVWILRKNLLPVPRTRQQASRAINALKRRQAEDSTD